MDLTRRQFSLGASALAGARGGVPSFATALPGQFGVPNADDAYEMLLTRYFALEEAALESGLPTTGEGGAISWEGRQLETYLSEMDMRVDVVETARQVIDGYKERLRDEVRKAAAEGCEQSGAAEPKPAPDAEVEAAVAPAAGEPMAGAESEAIVASPANDADRPSA